MNVIVVTCTGLFLWWEEDGGERRRILGYHVGICGQFGQTGQLVLTAVTESAVCADWMDGCFGSTYTPLMSHFQNPHHDWSNSNVFSVEKRWKHEMWVRRNCLFFISHFHSFITVNSKYQETQTVPFFAVIMSLMAVSLFTWVVITEKLPPCRLLWDKSNIYPYSH